MDGPLKNLLVVDLTRVLVGPYCTMILSDLGARVIKIEAPEIGDDSRKFGPFIEEYSAYFMSLNRGKESIALNLKKEEDKKIFDKILSKADILVENFKPGTLERWGYGWGDVSKKYPKLIYASASGFGQTGPLKELPAYDMVVQGMGGLMSVTGQPNSEPTGVGTSIGDITAGLFTTIGINAALYDREKTGKGGEVSTSLMANGAWANGVFIQAALMDIEFPERTEPLPRHPFYDFYQTKDNREFALGMINSRIEWPKLTEVLDRADWLQRELFDFDDAFQNADILRSELSDEFMKRSLDEINELLRNSGVTYGVLGKTTDHRDDKQFLETKTLVPLSHESFENLLTINSPFTIQDENKIDFSRAPNVGEHTKEVLENMGYSDAELEDLKDGSAIYWPNKL